MGQHESKNGFLIFVDTNVYLDFYRYKELANLSLLDKLENVKSQLIITCQVEMEFIKNRYVEFQKALKTLKSLEKTQIPVFLRQDRAAKAFKKREKEANQYLAKLRIKTEKLLNEPMKYDPVYKSFRRLIQGDFTNNLRFNDNANRMLIEALASRRFKFGYPPRKDSDTSRGDAFNWEWIIHCANDSTIPYDIIIVSRDGDFQNPWLIDEFKYRSSRKQHIYIDEKLSISLKRMEVEVTEGEEKEEEQIIATERMLNAMNRLTYIQNQLLASSHAEEMMRSVMTPSATLLAAAAQTELLNQINYSTRLYDTSEMQQTIDTFNRIVQSSNIMQHISRLPLRNNDVNQEYPSDDDDNELKDSN